MRGNVGRKEIRLTADEEELLRAVGKVMGGESRVLRRGLRLVAQEVAQRWPPVAEMLARARRID